MYNIGIDLGGTNIAGAIVDDKGQIIKKASTPTLSQRSSDQIINDIIKLCQKLLDETKINDSELNSIGIGTPGIIDNKKGEIVYINNLNFRNVNIREKITKHINKPIYLANDANAAAYGEFFFNSYQDINSFIAITLGTGVGSGIILNGKILTGAFNAGAEIGHMVIVKNGEKCTCGRNGCFERYASATALIREAKISAATQHNSTIYTRVSGNLDNIDAKLVFDQAEKGDALAKKLVDDYIENLGLGLANIINIFQPEVISIGGGISGQKDKLLKPLIEIVKHKTYGGVEMYQTKIMTAKLGNNAGLIGAAFLHQQSM